MRLRALVGKVATYTFASMLSIPFFTNIAFAAGPPGGDPVAGESLFAAKCLMCHGEQAAGGFAQQPIRGAGPGLISHAISTRADMNFLSYLSSQEIDDLSAYLAEAPTVPDDLPATATSTSVKQIQKFLYLLPHLWR